MIPGRWECDALADELLAEQQQPVYCYEVTATTLDGRPAEVTWETEGEPDVLHWWAYPRPAWRHRRGRRGGTRR